MKRAGVLSVISGFSGVGKGTIVKKLVEKEGYFCYFQSSETGRGTWKRIFLFDKRRIP